MSYRTRLALFFLLIVAIPIAVVAVLVAGVAGSSNAGKADARIATGIEVALALRGDAAKDARSAVMELVEADAVAAALGEGDRAGIRRSAESEGRRLGFDFLAITTPGDELLVIPEEQPVGVSALTVAAGDDYRIRGSVTDAAAYIDEVRRLTGLTAALGGATGVVVASDRLGATDLPAAGDSQDATIAGESFRAGSAALPGSPDARLTLFAPVESGGFLSTRPAIVLVVALILAGGLAGVLLIARLLSSQIAAMLAAAKRIGSGDFSKRVPVVGRDEMAGLAVEFNRMTDQLEQRIEELRRQRSELDRAVERLGVAIGAGLDRDALLTVVAENAVAVCSAEYARIALEDGTLIEFPSAASGPARDVGVAAEIQASADHNWHDTSREGGRALAAPISSPGNELEARGVLAIARAGQSFSEHEREAFQVVVGQAAKSIRNITAHEEVTEQATRDELTGLANNRSFRTTMDTEAQRAERFDHELSLVILDVDNFKSVNDTYGHLQGDEVLRRVGRILAEEPRAIDRPARYGGEEFVVALPETGIAGAVELAERLREALEAEEIPLIESDGVLRVTASFGTATMPGAATTVRDLFAAADEALYEAKRTGKNKVVTAPDAVPSRR